MSKLKRWLAGATMAGSLFTMVMGAPAQAARLDPTTLARNAHTAPAPAFAQARQYAPTASEAARFAEHPMPRRTSTHLPMLAAVDDAATNAAAAPAESPQVQPNGRVIYIDAGHGYGDPGAIHQSGGKTDLTENEANLAIAQKLADLLRQDGYQVILSRADSTSPSRGSTAADLQTRVREANDADADLFICIHQNSSENKSARGTDVYYCADRSFGDKNHQLATNVQEALVRELHAAGYDAIDKGVKDERAAGHFAVLAPSNLSQPTKMPGILGESLFISNDEEAAQLQRPEIQQAIAQGYFDGIQAYFAQN